MRRRRITVALWTLLLSVASGRALAGPPPSSPISGVVRHLEAPVSGVLVIFYNLGDSSLTRARTGADGTFVVATAPVGVYDLIAYKRGFEPALQRLWHQAAAQQVSAVSIALTRKGGAASPDLPVPATIWDLRERLPSDVLRELAIEESADAATTPVERIQLNRILAGEVKTIADVGTQSAAGSLSRTALGLHGGLPNGWQYGIAGDYARLGDPDTPGETITGNAAGLALDVAPSAAEQVRLSTRRNTLLFGDNAAHLQTHAASWSRGAEEGRVESVAARYIEEANLYRATALGTSLFPVASRTWEINGRYGRPASDSPGVEVAMTYRHREAAVGLSGVGVDGVFFQSAPDADLSASSSVRLSDRLQVAGGVVARYMGNGSAAYGIAPSATARYDLGPATVYVRGVYRVAGSTDGAATVMPRVTSIEDNQEPAATQSYAVGIERVVGRDTSMRLEASQQRMGELVRAFFEGDFLTDFDSVYLLDGNSVRQYKASMEQRLSDKLTGTVSVRYGSIDGNVTAQGAANYGISENRGHFWSARAGVEVLPTRTGIAIVVHGIRQDLETPGRVLANDADKLALSVAQDLSVVGVTPFGADWKLLLAFETARGTTTDRRDETTTANRLLGGVGISF
ncbi:MAG: carboxypeptidase-like regulatory domain-containing protein [Acidobacteriota bacterium]